MKNNFKLIIKMLIQSWNNIEIDNQTSGIYIGNLSSTYMEFNTKLLQSDNMYIKE